MSFKIGKSSNSELTKEIISQVNGLSYFPNFLSDKNHQQLLNVLTSIDYKLVSGRPTKFFGLEYTHRKRTHDSEIKEIPSFFNLLDPLNLNFHQLIIEYFRRDDGHNYIKESDIFGDSVIIICIGSSFMYSMREGSNKINFLVEPGSLLHISGESRKWERSIKYRIKERFNGLIIPREDFYTFTFRNIRKNLLF